MTRDTELTAGLALKYDASNPSGFETPTQLNARDTANRTRGNHTGTQLASTISDFDSTARGTVLSGLSTATNAVIAAADSFLVAFGKLQAQINANITAIGLRALASRLVSAGTGLTGGGDLSADRTISMPNVGTASTVGATNSSLSITTDAQGRVSAKSANLISILASQVSNFVATVLATVLTGLSTATQTAVVATDSILVAIGKLQGQLDLRAVSTTPVSTGTAVLNTAGTSTAFAKADHVHKTNLTWLRQASTTTATTTSGTDVVLTGLTHTTPPAGDYMALGFVNCDNSNAGRTITFSMYIGGVQVAESISTITVGTAVDSSYNLCLPITVNGSQDVEIRWRRSANTASAYSRSLTLLRVG